MDAELQCCLTAKGHEYPGAASQPKGTVGLIRSCCSRTCCACGLSMCSRLPGQLRMCAVWPRVVVNACGFVFGMPTVFSRRCVNAV